MEQYVQNKGHNLQIDIKNSKRGIVKSWEFDEKDRAVWKRWEFMKKDEAFRNQKYRYLQNVSNVHFFRVC